MDYHQLLYHYFDKIQMDKFVRVKRKSDSLDEPKTHLSPSKKHKCIKDTDKAQTSPSTQNEPKINWRLLRAENLVCDYCQFYSRAEADRLLQRCEKELTYNEGQLARVKIFGKWQDIPRQQVAYGDEGMSYTFSNNTVPARPWTPFLREIKDQITHATGYDFNFVLINKYRDGRDHIGEHRDDEKDLVAGHPIASLSLGQARDFVFKHAQSRGKNATLRIEPVKVELQHGSLLLMKEPTNTFWYHSLPPRKKLLGMRINMTFRKMVIKKPN